MQRRTIRVWDGVRPFSTPEDAVNKEHFLDKHDGNERITDVSEPALHFFPAAGAGPHPALLICPGGGYVHLSWTLEGLDIASMANLAGFSAFVLSYRCPGRREAARADAARAMRVIRSRAEEFAICPDKVGAIGFSAGAHLVASISAPATPMLYPATDELDDRPYRPDFIVMVYPAYLADDQLNLAPEFSIGSDTPPTLLIQTQDDMARVENSLGWYLALKAKAIPTEMHLFAEGGHGYGLTRTGHAVAEWGTIATAWLRRMANVL